MPRSRTALAPTTKESKATGTHNCCEAFWAPEAVKSMGSIVPNARVGFLLEPEADAGFMAQKIPANPSVSPGAVQDKCVHVFH